MALSDRGNAIDMSLSRKVAEEKHHVWLEDGRDPEEWLWLEFDHKGKPISSYDGERWV